MNYILKKRIFCIVFLAALFIYSGINCYQGIEEWTVFVEDEIKENYMGFVGQRLLEGYTQPEALKMAQICVDEAIVQAKKELVDKKKKWFKR